MAAESPPTKALLIGIDHYPIGEAGAAGGCRPFPYQSLAGAVADAGKMERYLCHTLGVRGRNVQKLLAPLPGRPAPGAALPTAAGMVAALEALEAEAAAGDHVLLYYSGHGGRAESLSPELKARGELDECLVPMDVADPTTPYVRDVEIAAWIDRVAARGAFVSLILDCCHSGGIRRGARRIRGGDRVDRCPRPASGLASPEEIRGQLERRRARTFRSATLEPTRDQVPTGYALLAACQANEKAIEDSLDGEEPCGVMTHCLLAALVRMGRGATYRQLHAAVSTAVHARVPSQTPRADGELDRPIFGREHLPAVWGITVLDEPDWSAKTLRLGAGSMHGLRTGARLEVYALASGPDLEPAARLETVELTRVRANESAARFIETGEPLRRIHPGDQACLVDPLPLARRLRVSLDDRSRQVLPGQLFAADHALLEEVGAFASADLEVAIVCACFEIRDRAGACLPCLGPALAVGDPAAPAELRRRLLGLAHFVNLRELTNQDPRSKLRGLVRFEAFGPGSGHMLDCTTLHPGDLVRLRVSNQWSEPVHLIVLAFQPDWRVGQLFPATHGTSHFLEAGLSKEIRIRLSLPSGLARGVDLLKAVVSTRPIDFGWLTRPPIDSPDPAADRGRRPLRGTNTGLAGLLGQLVGEQPPTRALRSSQLLGDEQWTAVDLELHLEVSETKG